MLTSQIDLDIVSKVTAKVSSEHIRDIDVDNVPVDFQNATILSLGL